MEIINCSSEEEIVLKTGRGQHVLPQVRVLTVHNSETNKLTNFLGVECVSISKPTVYGLAFIEDYATKVGRLMVLVDPNVIDAIKGNKELLSYFGSIGVRFCLATDKFQNSYTKMAVLLSV